MFIRLRCATLLYYIISQTHDRNCLPAGSRYVSAKLHRKIMHQDTVLSLDFINLNQVHTSDIGDAVLESSVIIVQEGTKVGYVG